MRRTLLFFTLAAAAGAASAQTQPAPAQPWYPAPAAAQPVLAPAAPAPAATQPAAFYQAAPALQAGSVSQAVADWRRLRQSEGYAFADYARFLLANPGWPGESALRRAAEKAMRPGEYAPTVIAFFAQEKPKTGNGHARLAEALAASGRAAEALAAAREAWASADLSAYDEANIGSRYWSSLTVFDHDRRADALLFAKKPDSAQRILAATSPTRRPAFAARIAMQLRSPMTETLYQAAAPRVASDAGLMMDRLRYLRDGGNEHLARQLAARPHAFTERPADPERFLDMLLLLAGGAVEQRQYSLGYNIARQLDDIFAPGVQVSDQPLAVRDKYTSLAWLAGTTAWSGLNRPADAAAMFDRYSRGGKSLQVLTKGLYWAGKASIAAGRLAQASAYFQRAAAYPELFYGQLALERVGGTVPPPGQLPTFAVNAQQRAAFAANRLAQATRLLGQWGRRDEQTLFVRALAESLDNDAERVLATEYARQIGRQDLAVWVARAARNKGSAFYVRDAFPQLPVQLGDSRMWSLAHGITRQESSFDRSAVSHAGARGMMQLMPGTAREQAGKMGMGYDPYRLTTDPSYNVLLGSAYFQRLLNMWGGNVPLAVASYNAGYGNVRKWVDRYGDPRYGNKDVLQWIEQIPFAETKGYVQRVIENSVVYDQLNPGAPRSVLHVSRYLGRDRPA